MIHVCMHMYPTPASQQQEDVMEARRRVREHAIALSAPQAGLTFSAGGDEVRVLMMCVRGAGVQSIC